MARNDSHGIEENIVEFIGFLHPLNAKPLSERVKNLKLAICSAGSSAILKLSNDSSANYLVCTSFYVCLFIIFTAQPRKKTLSFKIK